MEKKFTLRFFLIPAILLFNSGFPASAFAPATIHALYMDADNSLLKLNLTTAYGVKVVQVSFDGNDGTKGFFQIKNNKGVVVRQIDEVELIKSPSYFTIDVSGFESGDYTFSIKTDNNTYTSTITIK